MTSACPGWAFSSNHTSDEDGRIIIIWKNPATITFLHQSRQSITCLIQISSIPPFIFTAVYASNEAEERSSLWVELLYIQQRFATDAHPWLLGGDMNQIIHYSEHSSPIIDTCDSQMVEFRDCLSQLGLFDLRFNGPPFTWINNQPDNPIAKKLDRLLVNQNFISTFPSSQAYFIAPNISDHTPCLLHLNCPLPTIGSKPFKFLNYLSKHPRFLAVVREGWSQAGSVSNNLSFLSWKLKSLKGALKTLNSENYSNIQERVSETYNLLQCVQVQALHSPTSYSFQQESHLHEKWNFLRSIEESYFKQKSRINWLKEGDHNTTFFHRIVVTRNNLNAIRSITLPSGLVITQPEEISLHAISHFQLLLAPPSLVSLVLPADWFSSLSNFRLNQIQSNIMSTPPSSQEIFSVIHKLNQNKAPGPDGLTSGFFKSTWEIIGDEVLVSIKQFFSSAFLPSSINATILSLVPKFPGASSMSDYRPISCCTTLYKAISKLLVARLKPFLVDFIQPNQTAFIKGRLLLENTVLASELVSGYHMDKGPKRVAIKVDIAKAFDTLRWDFLFSCLRAIGLPNIYLQWLHACVCTPNFTVGFNGTIQGHFKSKRGLRQGDPLSPYLFVIALNALSLMLDKVAAQGRFKYHFRCESTKLTHLCFADDLLIFTDGSFQSVANIMDILSEFQQLSGLAISYQKTSFFSSGLLEEEKNRISLDLGISRGLLPVRYLGLPLCTKKLSLANCAPLLQQVKDKVSSWSSRCLSYAGRLLMLNTVVAGITNFWSSAFVLPKQCIKKLNSICGAYLWSGSQDGVHAAKVSWETITTTKQEGGLGVRDLITWNKACNIRLIWLLFFRAGSVWVAWYKVEVLKGHLHHFWKVKTNLRNSWLANKILKIRETAYHWIKLRIRNGRTCNFWTVNWSPFGNIMNMLQHETTFRLRIPITHTISDLYINQNWCMPNPRTDAQVEVITFLTSLTLTPDPDFYEWEVDNKVYSSFSTGTIYHCLRQSQPHMPWYTAVWPKGNIPKHSFLTWLFTLNRCPTRDRILKWGLLTSPLCLLCNSGNESRNHIFFECNFSNDVWKMVTMRCQILNLRDWDQTISYMQNLTGPRHKRRMILLAWQCSLYTIWRERNQRLHNNTFASVDGLFRSIDLTMRNRASSYRDGNPVLASALLQLWLAPVTLTL